MSMVITNNRDKKFEDMKKSIENNDIDKYYDDINTSFTTTERKLSISSILSSSFDLLQPQMVNDIIISNLTLSFESPLTPLSMENIYNIEIPFKIGSCYGKKFDDENPCTTFFVKTDNISKRIDCNCSHLVLLRSTILDNNDANNLRNINDLCNINNSTDKNLDIPKEEFKHFYYKEMLYDDIRKLYIQYNIKIPEHFSKEYIKKSDSKTYCIIL